MGSCAREPQHSEAVMNILDAILNHQDGAAVQQLAQQFGLDNDQAASAISALVPQLAAGVQRNIQQPGGLDSLLGALTGGGHDQVLNDPSLLGQAASFDSGNGILGHLLGSRDVSRQVASSAASQTGLSSDVLKQMLPLVATLVMARWRGRPAPPGPPPRRAPRPPDSWARSSRCWIRTATARWWTTSSG
jgi:hypothetical protein